LEGGWFQIKATWFWVATHLLLSLYSPARNFPVEITSWRYTESPNYLEFIDGQDWTLLVCDLWKLATLYLTGRKMNHQPRGDGLPRRLFILVPLFC
jgi:hypothetical protein